jgi:hypothetical protein
MSKIGEVLKNRDRVEKTQKARRKEEINSLRVNSAFKARLYDELKKIDMLLDSDEIDSVVITIPDEFLAKFGEAIYSEDLAEYDIQQVDGVPNQFYVKHKFIQF